MDIYLVMQSGEQEDAIVSKHRSAKAADRKAAELRKWSRTAIYVIHRWEA